ncbi:Protein of unknown function (DUF581) [Abeliophyllum distichum]|uniref:FLZ-type domain-containing protein n=1 Tax=Abeliophyllum distichum TaxID=126358 RepID=A0ABD1NZW4_9LAMI
MLGKKSKPVIGVLAGSLVFGNRCGLVDVGISPTSTMEVNIQSPRGLKFCDLEGVGLGIVAALEKIGEGQKEIHPNYAFCRRNSNRSKPIPVESSKNCSRFRGLEGMEMHKSYRNPFRIQSIKSKSPSIFDISLARFGSVTAFPGSNFLSSCNLCGKKLHGKDIYIYRGEKAFCSAKCRYRQIVMDERIEKCSSRSVDVSNSPYTDGHVFSTGILAI